MKIRRSLTVAACSLLALAFAGCGGGGGGGTSTPVPTSRPSTTPVTATPAPLVVIVPGTQSSGGGSGGGVNDGKNPSSYAVTSNPSGLQFQVLAIASVGGTPTVANSGTTPATVTPSATQSVLEIKFTASGYTVPIVQVYDGAHKVFYNASDDATGTVAISSLQSVRRGSAAVVRSAASIAGVKHRTFGAFRGSDIDPTRVAVRYSASALQASGRSPAAIEHAVGAVGVNTTSATSDTLRIVLVPAGSDAASLTRKLQSQAEVAEVSPVHKRHTLSKSPIIPPDPDFSAFGVTNVGQWYTVATGMNTAWNYSTGTGAKIAVIDTGIDENNTDLTSQLAYQESDITPIDSTCNPVVGATTVTTTNPQVIQDDNGHGTNTSGIAISASNQLGFAGAAYGAKLMAFRVFPPQTASCNDVNQGIGLDTEDEAAAINSAVAQGADVISLSVGGASFDQVEFNAIETAIADGVTVVAAAGNSDDGSAPGTLDYPGAYPGVISVGASALKDQYYQASGTTIPTTNGTYATSTEYVASYSQYGPSLSVVAPGGESPSCLGPNSGVAECDQDFLHWIWNYSTSTAYEASEECSTPSPATNCTALFNGTSQATPQVAATAGLLIAAAGGHKSLTPAAVAYVIDSTADNINDPHQGHGRLNAYRALAALTRDTSSYSGPQPQKTGTAELIAFAYVNSNTNVPGIVDANYPAGVPVNTDGTFRIADVPIALGSYRVAVWYDANADGVIDAGDQIGVASAICSTAATCGIGTITMSTVSAGYTLP